MTVDHYRGVAAGWHAHTARVYGPLAEQLVAAAPHPLAGRTALDLGAGTGLASAALAAAGARVLAMDLSADMLRWRRASRPPAVVAAAGALPLRSGAVDDAVAAFVLNHLTAPVTALRELGRVTRPGGAVLATAFAATGGSAARDRVDEVMVGNGFRFPGWYRTLTTAAAPLLSTPQAMAAAATAAGLTVVDVVEYRAELGLHDVAELVDYRMNQAQFRIWLDGLPPATAAAVRAEAVAAAAPLMAPYRPRVVRLVARSSGGAAEHAG